MDTAGFFDANAFGSKHFYFVYWHQRSGQNVFEDLRDSVLFSIEDEGIGGLSNYVSLLSSKIDGIESNRISIEFVMSNYSVENDLEIIKTSLAGRILENKFSGSYFIHLSNNMRLQTYYTTIRPENVVHGSFVVLLGGLRPENANEGDDLSLFQSEFDDYFRELKAPLSDYYNAYLERESQADKYTKDFNAIQHALASWKSKCILGMVRAVELLDKESLEWMIYTSLSGRELEIVCEDERVVDCLGRFHRLLQFISVGDSRITEMSDEYKGSIYSHKLTLKRKDGNVEDSGEVKYEITPAPVVWINGYCKSFAQELRQSANPFDMRRLINIKKTMVIRELNEMKKVVTSSVTDNYKLYHAFMLLRESSNSDVLLSLLAIVDSSSYMQDSIVLLRDELDLQVAKPLSSSE